MKAVCKLPIDPENSAKLAGLRYLHDLPAGIRRRRAGRGWLYFSPNGTRLSEPLELQRINELVIPPKWADVWISPHRESHLQAVGYDARGRRQYRYHPEFRKIRDATKFHRMAAFAAALPILRERVAEDLMLRGLPKQKVIAALIRLFDETSMRVGNREYVRTNQSFGLTTLTNDHVEIRNEQLIFRFKGKSGVEHEVDISNRRLAKIIQACQEIPGQELFQYLDDKNEPHPIHSENVNAYMREATEEDLTAKDFRTWNGTCAAFRELCKLPRPKSVTEAKACVVLVVKQVAAILGNRPATCRKYYIHPAIPEAFLRSATCRTRLFTSVPHAANSARTHALSPQEQLVLRLVSEHRPEVISKHGRRRFAA